MKSRKKLILALIFALVLLAIAGCAGTGTIPRGWAGVATGDNTAFVATMDGKLAAINLTTHTRQWTDYKFEPPKSSGGFGCANAPAAIAIYGTPGVGKGLVYVGGYDGKLYAITADRGLLRWVFPRQENIAPLVGGLLQASGRIFFGSSNGIVYALNAETGDPEWQFPTGDKVWSSPAADKDTVYVGSFDKKMYALNIADGRQKWEPFATEGAIASTPAIREGVLYFGSFDRYFYAVNTTDGKLKWKSAVRADRWFWADPVFAGSTLYAPSLDGKLYAFRADNGSLLSSIDLGEEISSSPVVNGDTIIVATRQGKLFSIDTATNQQKQLADLKQKIDAPLTIEGGIIYLHTDQDTLYAVDAQFGTVLWTFALKT